MADNKDNPNQKKPMKKGNKRSTKSVLIDLYYDRLVISKVDLMLDEGKSIPHIHDYVISKGHEVSLNTLYNYRDKRKESLETGVPLIQLLEKRKQGNVKNIKHKEARTTMIDGDSGLTVVSGGKNKEKEKDMQEQELVGDGDGGDSGRQKRIFNDIEILDKIIEVGAESIPYYDYVDPVTLTKIIEAKNKITGNQLQGMSVAGLRELKLAQEAKALAVQSVIFKYIDENKIDDVMREMEEAEEEYRKELELTGEGENLLNAVNRAGIEF